MSLLKITTDVLPPVELILNNVGTRISGLVVALDSKVDLLRQKMESDFQSLRKTLDTLNDSMSNLSVCLQEHKEQTTAELDHLHTSLNSTQSSLANQIVQLYNKLVSHANHSSQLKHKLYDLCSEVNGLSSKLDTFNTSLFQQQKQTTAELTNLQTSHISTNSKLDSLTATAAQLSSDHQEIQTNISDVQCMDTQPSLQVNLTHTLETIKRNFETLSAYSCGGTGGWRRVVYLDMTDPHTTCPSGWNMTGYSKRTCGRNSTGYPICSSATFPVSGGEYNRICGRMKAYQWGTTVAFFSYHYRLVTTIDGAYASGVSVTHGTPRNHIWTFVAGLSEATPGYVGVCPCDATRTIRIPPFVGNDYFCESGVNEPWNENIHVTLHSSDTLWDGEDCIPSSTCCSQHNPPYFNKQLPTPTTDDIEARICLYDQLLWANLAVELVELYVQ